MPVSPLILLAVAPWLLVAPLLASAIRRKTTRAIDALLRGMAQVAEQKGQAGIACDPGGGKLRPYALQRNASAPGGDTLDRWATGKNELWVVVEARQQEHHPEVWHGVRLALIAQCQLAGLCPGEVELRYGLFATEDSYQRSATGSVPSGESSPVKASDTTADLKGGIDLAVRGYLALRERVSLRLGYGWKYRGTYVAGPLSHSQATISLLFGACRQRRRPGRAGQRDLRISSSMALKVWRVPHSPRARSGRLPRGAAGAVETVRGCLREDTVKALSGDAPPVGTS